MTWELVKKSLFLDKLISPFYCCENLWEKKKNQEKHIFWFVKPSGNIFSGGFVCVCETVWKNILSGEKKMCVKPSDFFCFLHEKKQTFFSWKCFFCVRFHTWEHYFSLNFFFSLVFTDIKEKHVLTSPSKSFFFFHHQFSSHKHSSEDTSDQTKKMDHQEETKSSLELL